MAVTKDQIKTNYPLPVYNYKVDIVADSGTATVAFSEVSGLSLEYETITYKESQTETALNGPNIMYMPTGIPQPVNISLKKGLVKAKSMPVLYNWIDSTELNRVEKKDIVIKLCDEAGNVLVTWTVKDAFPTKIDAPSFDSNSYEAAIESMELMASRITMA